MMLEHFNIYSRIGDEISLMEMPVKDYMKFKLRMNDGNHHDGSLLNFQYRNLIQY